MMPPHIFIQLSPYSSIYQIVFLVDRLVEPLAIEDERFGDYLVVFVCLAVLYCLPVRSVGDHYACFGLLTEDGSTQDAGGLFNYISLLWVQTFDSNLPHVQMLHLDLL